MLGSQIDQRGLGPILGSVHLGRPHALELAWTAALDSRAESLDRN